MLTIILRKKMKRHFIIFLIPILCLTSKAQKNIAISDSLLQLLHQSKSDTLKVKYQIALGQHYLFTNPPQAEKWLLEANKINVVPKEKNIANKAYCANSLVQVYFVMGKVSEAEKWMTTALALAQQTENPDIIANAFLNTATVYSQTQRLDKAIPYAQRITAMYDSLGTPEKSVKALVTLGNIFVQLPKYDKALEYYGKAAALNTKDIANKDYYLLTAFGGMAYVYQQKRKFDSCLIYSNLAYKHALFYPQPDLYSHVLVVKASALEQLGRSKEVIPVAREGMEVCIANSINHYRIMFYAQMAKALAQNKQQDSAMYYAKLAQLWIDSSNMANRYVEMNNTWAEVNAYAGNYKKAYDYKVKAYLENEAIKEAEVIAQTTAADVMFETTKKEKQIDYLNAINKQQRTTQWVIGAALLLALIATAFAYRSYRNKKKAADVLEQSNKEKEVFLKEIHHRVKNNLQIISSLLYMQFKDNKDESMMAQLKQAQERIKSMALVHNKLYETSDVVHVYLKEYIADLATGILSSNTPAGKDINLHITEERPVNLSLDTSISLGLILNELITNSCKYAFTNQQQGNISIAITQQNNQYTLQVKDDGSGLPKNFEQKNSLGVRLVKNLARQLSGSVQFINNNGTTVSINFKDSMAA
jgi:two-component system, sensor histidine kinase PdtaS